MKLLYIGDFVKKNGPSIVDLNYRKYLEKVVEKSLFYQSTNYRKIFKLIKDINKYDYIIISGISFTGALVSLIAKKFFNKKVYYICHGLLKYESKFHKVKTRRFIFEKIIMNNSHLILTVSKLLKEKCLELYSIPAKKVQIQYNGIKFENKNNDRKKQKYTLLSVGGGRREKRILNICKAIELSAYRDKINFIVVGENGEESEEIKKFPFVQYLGFVSQKEIKEIYTKAEIFILISAFDSFSSSFFEAIQYKCSVIVSENIGALELLPDDLLKLILVDGENIELISKKIDFVLEHPNYNQIYDYILNNYENYSWEKRTKELFSKLENETI